MGSGCLTRLRRAGDWRQQLEWGKKAAGTRDGLGRTRGWAGGGRKRRLPFLPQERWSLASCRSYPKSAKSGILFRCIWLSLGTGQGGSLNISEAELPPSERESWARNPIPRVGAGGGVSDAKLAKLCSSHLGSSRQPNLGQRPGGGESSRHSGSPGSHGLRSGNFKDMRTLESPGLTMRGTEVGGGSPKITQQIGSRTRTRSRSWDSLPRSSMASEWSLGLQARSPGPGSLVACVFHLGCRISTLTY